MANLVLRLVKGAPVTDEEMDTNLTNLNKDSYLSVRNSTPWVASTAFAKGEILNVDTRFYLVTAGGTTSGIAPSHTSGTATNGTTQLQFGGISYYSAKDVLDKVKSLGGVGSGLDADTIRALTPSATVPTITDKSSIVARDISGNSSYNNITAVGVGAQSLTITGASNLNTLAITSTFSVRGVPGNDGQFLISRGSTAQPEWVDVSLNPNVINENTNAVRYITFVDSTGAQTIKVDSGISPLTYNPSTNTISATLNGAATTAGSTTTVTSGGSVTTGSLNVGDQVFVPGTGLYIGNLGVGTGSPTEKLHVVGNIYDQGNIICTGNITAFFSSDQKFKTNIQDITNAVDVASAIGGKTFTWTQEYLNEHGNPMMKADDFGVIAQDVLSAFPIAVYERTDGSLAVDYVKLIAVAFAAIKELKSEIEALKNGS